MVKGEFESGLLDRKPAYMLFPRRGKGPGVRETPECIRLDPEPGAQPSTLAPVRIFMGTEPAQYRAERVFVWSVLQKRDPGRAYEIYLMKEVSGFDRCDWKTGFSRYRFAIPSWAGGEGRAIYNDVDQIYLRDPGELFDLDMGGNAVLAISKRETSVMLLDCSVLGELWTLEDAHVEHKKHFRALTEGIWGPLDPSWNARDWEYVAGETDLLHYSTLHTQPWRPFPDQFRYRKNAVATVFHEHEQAADAAGGFTLFTRARPSSGFADACSSRPPDASQKARSEAPATLRKLIRETGAKSLLSVGRSSEAPPASFGGEAGTLGTVSADLAEELPHAPGDGRFDGVVALGVLDGIPEEDVPWVLGELFERARHFVFVQVSCAREAHGRIVGEDHRHTAERPGWWREELERAALRFPDRTWALACRQPTLWGERTRTSRGPKALRGAH